MCLCCYSRSMSFELEVIANVQSISWWVCKWYIATNNPTWACVPIWANSENGIIRLLDFHRSYKALFTGFPSISYAALISWNSFESIFFFFKKKGHINQYMLLCWCMLWYSIPFKVLSGWCFKAKRLYSVFICSGYI